MKPLRIAAVVAFLAAVVVFAIRQSAVKSGRYELQGSRQAERRVEARLLLHRTDSILAMDDDAHLPVAIAFPRARPVVAFLYRTDCSACQRVKPVWEELADELAGRVDVLAATLDVAGPEGRFLRAKHVRHLSVDGSEKFVRAFGVWHVVPVSLVIAPSGRVWWAKLGSVDSVSRGLPLAAVSEVMGTRR